MNMPIDGSGLTFIAGQTYDYIIAVGEWWTSTSGP